MKLWKPDEVLNIFDNARTDNVTIDRYSISIQLFEEIFNGFGYLICTSITPYDPNGVWSIAEGGRIDTDECDPEVNKNFGEEIEWKELHESVQIAVYENLIDAFQDGLNAMKKNGVRTEYDKEEYKKMQEKIDDMKADLTIAMNTKEDV
jgi:hypothetical protein